MCGIVGLYNYGKSESVDPGLLKKMNDHLEHRGPDDEGFFVKGNVGLAMRRLAIIDLSSGKQPMSSDDGRVHIVFNGEIYNFQAIREQLEKDGVRFKTKSDTEVILRLYEKSGVDCVQQLRGMFAFSIWDETRKRLLLVRDRIGKKPLLYANVDGRLAWASEFSALLALPHLSREIDTEALDLYLGLQYVPSPHTIYRSIRKLPPAHTLLMENGRMRVERYWSLPSSPVPAPQPSLEEAKKIIREKFEEATHLRMISDVPLGAFLSGGIDSTLVVGMMSRLSSRPVKTFSIGFEEQEFSELAAARETAKFFKTEHSEFIVKPRMVDVLPTLARHYGEPFGDSSALPMYYLSRETRKHVTVALSGDGGDENFGGYNRYVAMKLMEKIDLIPYPLRKALTPLGTLLSGKGKRFFEDILAAEAGTRYFATIGIFTEAQKKTMYRPEFMREISNASRAVNYLSSVMNQSKNHELINQLLYTDIATYLPECLMVKADIASMANSLEIRSPFLDHELIEQVFGFPGEWKLKGFNKTKWILRQAFPDLLPEHILNRPKMGFGIPLDQWFRGELRGFWNEKVLSTNSISRTYFNQPYLEKLTNEHMSGKKNHGYRMWVLLMLEITSVR